MRSPRHFIVALALALAIAHDAGAQTTASTFRIFVRGVEAGIEEVTLLESPDGWTLRGSGKLRAPLNLATEYWETKYDREWRPTELNANFTENANRWTIRTTFRGTSASSEVIQDGQTQSRTLTVAPETVAVPNLVFGAYEALAARLAASKPGAELDAFIAPQDSVHLTVNAVTDETIEIPGRKITARRWSLRVTAESATTDMEVWTDGSRLLRLDLPVQMVSVVRDDIASVSARVVTLARPNDEPVSIPSIGFSLAATISRPAQTSEAPPAPGRKAAPVRLPAIVLISGSAPTDRDEIVAGIPIFAQMANALADAGFLVVRYDERATGQSGGRQESATLDEYAVDARSVVTYLARRKDVDPKRIAVLGYGEGGWIGLLAASREERIGAVGLIATPSVSGSALVLEQQRRHFGPESDDTPAEQASIEQQKKIFDAVMTGKGWESLPPDVRRRVDTPLYRSFLTFDPAVALPRVRQPLLVVQPMLDQEVPPRHGEQLAQLARSRPRAKVSDYVQAAGVNHLLTSATTGDVAEYSTLPQKIVNAPLMNDISSWLTKTLPPEPPK